MSPRSWLRSWLPTQLCTPLRHRPRLAAEALEQRDVPAAVAAPSGLVSWWTADGTAADLTGMNNATLFNGTTYAAAEVGQGFNFDGVNDRAQVADSDSLKFTTSMSIEGWILVRAFPTGSPNDHGEIFFRGDDRGGLDPYSLSVEPNGTLNFQVTNASNASSSIAAAVPLGQLLHVVATLDDATGAMKLYVNGSVVAQAVTTIRPFRDLDPASNPSIGIGNHGGYPNTPHNFPFNGLIDELSVYDRALTSGEVLGIYSAGVAGKIKSSVYVAADFPSVVEGSAASSTLVTFTIRRVGNLSGQAVVNWSTASGTATAGSDYVAASGQVVFEDGESEKTVTVSVNGDDTPEPNESFNLVLSTTTPGYAVGMGQATIVDEDVAVSVEDTTATEGDARIGQAMGAFVGQFDNGGMDRSTGMAWGPDGNLYVGSLNTNQVLRFDGTTGEFLGVFIDAVDSPAVQGLIFRPDGLYILSRNAAIVQRFDATTGAFLGVFIPAGSGGLTAAKGMTVGPDGNWYISSGTNQILRYSGTTGAFLGAFVSTSSGGLNNPRGLTFGPDGNLYVASGASNAVLRYNGQTGAFINAFVPAGSGGLASPGELLFRNGSLYVSSQGANEILRYDAQTGTFLDKAATAGPGGVSNPLGLLFDSNGSLLVGNYGEIARYGVLSQAAFTVRLNIPSTSPVTVNYTTSSGSATAGSDFTPVSGTITFAPGETTKTVLVPTLNDAVAEGTETFSLTLSNAVGATITDGTGVATITDDDATKFYVADDGSTDRTYRYGTPGNALANSTLSSGNAAPRGAASTAAGDKVWVVDANKTVYVYNAAGTLLGSWSAGGLKNSAQLEGIATNGTDVWLIDSNQDKVYKYTGAASRLSGTQNAASSFNLNGSNGNGKGIVTDGNSLWVVDDGTSTDKVFKYTLSGSLLGSWTIDAANSHPTGLTINPASVSDIWIVDNGTDRVYQYTAAASRTSGSQSASATFALAPGNTNPQDIADPPPSSLLLIAATPVVGEAVSALWNHGHPLAVSGHESGHPAEHNHDDRVMLASLLTGVWLAPDPNADHDRLHGLLVG